MKYINYLLLLGLTLTPLMSSTAQARLTPDPATEGTEESEYPIEPNCVPASHPDATSFPCPEVFGVMIDDHANRVAAAFAEVANCLEGGCPPEL